MTDRARRRFPLVVRIGQVLSVLIVILWVWSIGRQIMYVGEYYVFQFATNGVVYLIVSSEHALGPILAAEGFSASPLPYWGFELTMPKIRPIGPTVTSVEIPLWMLLIAIATPTAILWSRHRNRPMPGCCTKCRYDLTGNESGICPECGTEIERP